MVAGAQSTIILILEAAEPWFVYEEAAILEPAPLDPAFPLAITVEPV